MEEMSLVIAVLVKNLKNVMVRYEIILMFYLPSHRGGYSIPEDFNIKGDLLDFHASR